MKTELLNVVIHSHSCVDGNCRTQLGSALIGSRVAAQSLRLFLAYRVRMLLVTVLPGFCIARKRTVTVTGPEGWWLVFLVFSHMVVVCGLLSCVPSCLCSLTMFSL